MLEDDVVGIGERPGKGKGGVNDPPLMPRREGGQVGGGAGWLPPW